MLRGAPNYRDLGGTATAEGRSIRSGSLLRCGHLGELHAEDIAVLQQRVGSDVCVLDLRGGIERRKHPCALPRAQVHSLPIEPSVAARLDALVERGEPLTARAAHGFMADAYRNFVRNTRPQMAAVFDHALNRYGKPLLVHCTAGKDRTGFTISLLLLALGVPRSSIMDDYLLTNQRVSRRESARYPAEIMDVLGFVRADYLEAAFAAIDGEFGGVDAFLRDAIGLSPQRREALREALLTP
jgi:protein-tyrosine phosphatase